MMMLGPEICHVDRCPHGCTSETGCGGHEQRRRAPEHYKARLDELVAEASHWGVDLRAALAVPQDAQCPAVEMLREIRDWDHRGDSLQEAWDERHGVGAYDRVAGKPSVDQALAQSGAVDGDNGPGVKL